MCVWTDGGRNWNWPGGIKACATLTKPGNDATNDQWLPEIAVHPNGNQLFLAWYDRQRDPNNSLIDLNGRWGAIASNGTVTLGAQFRITTESFPPGCAGTLPENWVERHYDPVWPPGDDLDPPVARVNLRWRYYKSEDWYPYPPQDPSDWHAGVNCTWHSYRPQASEHNGVRADGSCVYLAWADARGGSLGTPYPGRNQVDIRFARLPWPVPWIAWRHRPAQAILQLSVPVTSL
jgi:hypothetical protein